MAKKITIEEFIEKATIVHGDKYDYSEVEYVNSKTKIKIICPDHGIFEQTPSLHLGNHNCLKCSGLKKLNTEEFIEKATIVHGGKYDYSEVNYINSKTKIKIICPDHGIFEQEPKSHLNKTGCQKCGTDKAKIKLSGNITDFIEKAKKIHKNKYDYSQAEYINCITKIKIICPDHGIFEQLPNNHLSGSKCPTCAYSENADNHRTTIDSFINAANKVHKNKYDYSKVVYLHGKKNVIIICPEHGEFIQKPNSHLNSRGCPKCNESKGEKEICRLLDNFYLKFEQQKKFADCRNTHKLPFDFYLTDYQILIEYDGEQHFRISEFFGGEEKFKKQQINDTIKTQYCIDKNIPLLRIKFNENIEEKLNSFLFCFL